MKHIAIFDPELLADLLQRNPAAGLRELGDAASRKHVEIVFRRLDGVGGPAWDARAHFLLRIEIAAEVKQLLESPVKAMANTTPSWANGLSTAVEIEARQMASVLRFYPREGAEFHTAMRHLCRMLTDDQQRKDHAGCNTSAPIQGAASSPKARTAFAAKTTAKRSTSNRSRSYATQSAQAKSDARPAASGTKRTRR